LTSRWSGKNPGEIRDELAKPLIRFSDGCLSCVLLLASFGAVSALLPLWALSLDPRLRIMDLRSSGSAIHLATYGFGDSRNGWLPSSRRSCRGRGRIRSGVLWADHFPTCRAPGTSAWYFLYRTAGLSGWRGWRGHLLAGPWWGQENEE
jgi:hypothetical protein